MSGPFRVACVQTNAGRDFEPNIKAASELVQRARAAGAALVLLPENVSMMEPDTALARQKACAEAAHPALAAFRELARAADVWLVVGSLSVLVDAEKIANRSYLIDASGEIAARYDKIHLFDVDLSAGERYRESDTIAAGARAVVAPTPWGALGLSICYDLRFPKLYRHLAHQGADFLSIPAAFTRTTGQAHWHILIRARAIENGCFVFAPAQTGTHAKGRQTYGHALIVDPWGEVLADAGEEVGFIVADIDPAKVAEARARIPALMHERPFT